MSLKLDSMDEEQVRTAAKLLERENERLLREVLELKQKLSAAQGNSVEQMTLLAELEQKLAARNKMLFGRSSEKRCEVEKWRQGAPVGSRSTRASRAWSGRA